MKTLPICSNCKASYMAMTPKEKKSKLCSVCLKNLEKGGISDGK